MYCENTKEEVMKKDRTPKKTKESSNTETKKITRKEAIKKAGKYAALTAATTLIILSPKEGQASSEAPTDPGWGT